VVGVWQHWWNPAADLPRHWSALVGLRRAESTSRGPTAARGRLGSKSLASERPHLPLLSLTRCGQLCLGSSRPLAMSLGLRFTILAIAGLLFAIGLAVEELEVVGGLGPRPSTQEGPCARSEAVRTNSPSRSSTSRYERMFTWRSERSLHLGWPDGIGATGAGTGAVESRQLEATCSI
jgi:hypothetical protein